MDQKYINISLGALLALSHLIAYNIKSYKKLFYLLHFVSFVAKKGIKRERKSEREKEEKNWKLNNNRKKST